MLKEDHILVVDDEGDICWALGMVLDTQGCRVKKAMNGKEAFRKAQRERFDLAFVDVKLPDMNGIEVARRIKEMNKDTDIVIISGYLYEEDLAIQEGLARKEFLAFLSKPLDLDEIYAITEQSLGKRRFTSTRERS